jgi:hypothetical protein
MKDLNFSQLGGFAGKFRLHPLKLSAFYGRTSYAGTPLSPYATLAFLARFVEAEGISARSGAWPGGFARMRAEYRAFQWPPERQRILSF